MRIVVDMQGAQSSDSHDCATKRHTLNLVQSMVRQRCSHEIRLVLNGQLTETIEPIRAAFDGQLPQSHIHVWHGLSPVFYTDVANQERRSITELIYEAFLSSLEPDFIFITSLFEGLNNNAVSCVHRLQTLANVAVILNDPWLSKEPDLDFESPIVKAWCEEKTAHLKRADLWLATSESSRQESIAFLGLPPKRTHNIATDDDEVFKKITVTDNQKKTIQEKFGIEKPFVMSAGDPNYQENFDGQIQAYALLPPSIRQQHQLIIVGALHPANRDVISLLANKLGLGPQEVLVAELVSDIERLTLYNLCRLFVPPSWQAGFGQAALEAIRCGAPVIGANDSGLPEISGSEEALVDPHDPLAMARMIERGLTDNTYRQALVRRETVMSTQFSSDESARRAMDAMQAYWYESKNSHQPTLNKSCRATLAFVSPLPSARSGIADYSAELLPALSKYYDIDVVVEQTETIDDPWITKNARIRSSEWFAKNSDQYARVLYHFGNSAFHQHMFDLLEDIPGVVVLHDFFLSGIQAFRDANGHRPAAWAMALFESHGYHAFKDRFDAANPADIIFRYPVNLDVLQRAQGILIHSRHSLELADKWYGVDASEGWDTVPLLRVAPQSIDRTTAREGLGYKCDDLLICSFGAVSLTKLSKRILQAWLESELSKDPRVHLIFVGQNDETEYGESLQKLISGSAAKDRIKITGWASATMFKQYLAAADVGVQLRTLSRGETSAAVLDCLNHGLATIVNAHGSMADLDPDIVWRLPDVFTADMLTDALTVLATNPKQRAKLGERGKHFVHQTHEPAICARQYFDSIERFHARSINGLGGLLDEIRTYQLKTTNLFEVAQKLAASFPPTPRQRQLLVDVSGLVSDHTKQRTERSRQAREGLNEEISKEALICSIVEQWIQKLPFGFRVEPVYVPKDQDAYHYARAFTCQLLDIPAIELDDAPVDAFSGDVFVGLACQSNMAFGQIACLHEWRNRGVAVWFVIDDDLSPVKTNRSIPPDDPLVAYPRQGWLATVSAFDGVACTSKAVAEQFESWLSINNLKRLRPLKIDVLTSPNCQNSADKLAEVLCSTKN